MIKPMLCNSIKEEELNTLKGDYKANIKYDGTRCIAIKDKEYIILLGRNGRIITFIYPEIVEQLKKIKDDFIFDGEIITQDGLFNSLQHRSNLSDRNKIRNAEKDYPIDYMVFDILSLNGNDLRNKPLKERIEVLEKFRSYIKIVCYTNIRETLSYVKSINGEGIVIKDMLSHYEGRRSPSWIKLKLFKETNLKVVRYTINNAGIRAESEDFIAVQIAGEQHKEVKRRIDEKGYCDITIQYLEKTKEDKFRFISFKEVVGVKK